MCPVFLGTLIETLHGPLPVEDLQARDRVRTLNGTYEPIRWSGARRLTPAQLQANPKLRPILIRADTLGMGYPRQDLRVSPQHRVLVSSRIAMRMLGCKEVLIPAHKLVPLTGIEVLEDAPEGVAYWHILFDDHQIIWSNGTPSESLFTGPEALRAVSCEGREEIQTLFPKICKADFKPVSARHIPEQGKRVKKLIQRHQANNMPLYCPTLSTS